MIFVVYGRLYLNALMNALGMVGKNVWTLMLPAALYLAWYLALIILSPILGGGMASGFVGGFILATLRAALLSVYSYFLAQLVGRQVVRVSVDEFKTGIGAYFVNWISFFFLIFMVSLGVEIATKYNRDADTLMAGLWVIAQILLNTVPETIYLKGSANGIDTIQRAYRFFAENWIEWLIPNSVLIAAMTFGLFSGGRLMAGIPFGVVLIPIIGGMLLHVFMVFRGFLYEALDGSTHRQRMYKYRGSL